MEEPVSYLSQLSPLHQTPMMRLTEPDAASDVVLSSRASPLHSHRIQVANQKRDGTEFLRNRLIEHNAVVHLFTEFLQNNDRVQKRLQALYDHVSHVDKASTRERLVIDITLFEAQQSRLMRDEPMSALPAFEAAVKDYWDYLLSESGLKMELTSPRIGISGWMGANHITPRGLNSNKLDKLVCVEGVVNKCSVVHPKLVESVYIKESNTNGKLERGVYIRPHFDITDLDKSIRDAALPPANDVEGKVVNKVEIGMCLYKNHQKFVIQETPETAPTGQMPRWVNVIVEDNLCDKVKCGDRVRAWGVYRMYGGRANADTTGTGKPYLIANNVQKQTHEREFSLVSSSDYDIANFTAFAKREDVLDVLALSFAPSICGLEIVKKGLILMIVGGAEKLLDTGHHIRGDTHVLLVGDPSCGKSQLLRYVMNIMKGTVSATGRGSSGVGLTAAVVTDQDTGERRVEGGAMVLADRHIICIDEFDKMQKSDRAAIHEVMEQQTVTVAKAGIHTTLNARCTILAAANPVYGCWGDDEDLAQQLNFEVSLLSRFDLIFIIRDSATEAEDEGIALSILRNITTKSNPVKADVRRGTMDNIVQSTPDLYETQMEKYPINTEKPVFAGRHEMVYYGLDGEEHEVLNSEFLQKYLNYSKNEFYEEKSKTAGWAPYPEISEEANNYIIELFAEIRQKPPTKKLIQSITTRTLEAIIRLSTAHAKLKLKRWVTKEDVGVARDLLMYTLFAEKPYSNGYESDRTSAESLSEDENTPNINNRTSSRVLNKPPKTLRSSILKDVSKKRPLRSSASSSFQRVSILDQQLSGMSINDAGWKRHRNTADANTESNDSETNSNHNMHRILIEILSHPTNANGLSFDDLFELVIKKKKDPTYTRESFHEWIRKEDSMTHPLILYSNGFIYPC